MAIWNFLTGKNSEPNLQDSRISDFPSIHIFIPSFNRNNSLKELIYQIDGQSADYQVCIYIFDDGSEEPVSLEWTDFHNIKSLSVSRSKNHGKKRYWHLVNRIFSIAENKKSEIFYYLADDVSLVPNFFRRSINAWNGIVDQNKVAINLILDQREGQTCWTNYPPHLAKTTDLAVYKCQWVDMVMMFSPRMLEALSYKVDPISEDRWVKRPLLSSGVGAQLSHRLHDQGLSMFQVTDSLVLHGDAPSVMNPEERARTPIVSKTR